LAFQYTSKLTFEIETEMETYSVLIAVSKLYIQEISMTALKHGFLE